MLIDCKVHYLRENRINIDIFYAIAIVYTNRAILNNWLMAR